MDDTTMARSILEGLYKISLIAPHEYSEGLRLMDSVDSEPGIHKNRIVRNRKALRRKLISNNTEPYVKWLMDHYYKQ